MALPGCTNRTISWSDDDRARVNESEPTLVLPRIHHAVQPEIDRYQALQQAAVLKALSQSHPGEIHFSTVTDLATDSWPWTSFTTLEAMARRGLRVVQQSPSVLYALEQVTDLEQIKVGGRPSAFHVPVSIGRGAPLDVMAHVLDEAMRQRVSLLASLSRDEREFLFDEAATVATNYVPQISEVTESVRAQLADEGRWVRLLHDERVLRGLVSIAAHCATLLDVRQLADLSASFLQADSQSPRRLSVPGITGEVLAVRETAAGLIVIGGRGPNHYALDGRIALLIDLGGDDIYEGLIGANASAEQGLSFVIDLGGNDQYRSASFGLGTGRLGIGMVVDVAGDDVYELAMGSGGVGLAGIGILEDRAGNDQYRGTSLTQGAAIMGVGVLVDRAGHDSYTAHVYGIGFGGPHGMGALFDLDGNDVYVCGGAQASHYNALDAPKAKPGDADFQYDCFGLGAGAGRRVFVGEPALSNLSQSGGIGLLLDDQGDDRYDSANFSQGVGYYKGTGVKIDLHGSDRHAGARYTHGAAAHQGIGFFLDGGGQDRYLSTGPLYTGGVAWDASLALCVDAGQEDDVYELQQSDGLGRADHRSWSIFVDEGGQDRYQISRGLGEAGVGSLSAFVDLGGEDDYRGLFPVSIQPESDVARRGNRRTITWQSGGVFVDR